jgi:hypothetical protein
LFRRTKARVGRLADLAHYTVRRKQDQRRVHHEPHAVHVAERNGNRYVSRDRSARRGCPYTPDLATNRVRRYEIYRRIRFVVR